MKMKMMKDPLAEISVSRSTCSPFIKMPLTFVVGDKWLTQVRYTMEHQQRQIGAEKADDNHVRNGHLKDKEEIIGKQVGDRDRT